MRKEHLGQGEKHKKLKENRSLNDEMCYRGIFGGCIKKDSKIKDWASCKSSDSMKQWKGPGL